MRVTWKRAAMAAVALVAVGAAGLRVAQPWLAEKAFERALDRNLGVDRLAPLGDGLHVYVCGSGSPLPDADRAGPCLGVVAGQQAFVFDAGSGSVRKLLRMGFPIERLRAAYLTHLHSDHFDGLGELLLQAWIGGSRAAPLPVRGPEGVDQVVGGLAQAYAIDKGFRVAHHGEKVANPGGFGGKAEVVALAAGQDSAVVYNADGVKITAIRVNHAPVAPAFGYRVDYAGRSVVLSGDTAATPTLAVAGKGADVVFHEAMNKRMVAMMGAKLAERGHANAAQIMHDIQGYHATPEEAADTARAAGAKALVLYHLVPAPPVRLIEPLFLGEARKHFSGRLELARDGLLVSLPAGDSAVKFRHEL
jgi:ribonuclease Z